jgi:hypothetical protein
MPMAPVALYPQTQMSIQRSLREFDLKGALRSSAHRRMFGR